MPTVKVNDIDIFYELHGQGEPIVLITGLGNDLTQYEHIIAGLAQKHRVLAFDNRGSGRTDKPDREYTIDMMADDAAALMTAINLERAHVIGISMGGRIAAALAFLHPERVKSLVLVSTFVKLAPKTMSVRLLKLMNRIPVIRKGLSKYPQPYYAFARQLKASRGYDGSARLGCLHIPTLIIHGRNDRLAPVRLAEEMNAGIKGSKMITFDGGHIFFMGMQEKFCDTVSAFLAGIKE